MPREFQVEIEELSKRVEEIPELEVKLHEALQGKEQVKVQLNELRAKQTEEGKQQLRIGEFETGVAGSKGNCESSSREREKST